LDDWYKQDAEREQYAQEHCAARNITREEYDDWLFQGNTKPSPRLPTPEPCDCKEHPFDFFCPQQLVEYRSMNEPDVMIYLDIKQRLKPEDLNVREGD
ncbi:MAG: hypothetical protein Q9196_007190, partial [Gyalolechia fulgens]